MLQLTLTNIVVLNLKTDIKHEESLWLVRNKIPSLHNFAVCWGPFVWIWHLRFLIQNIDQNAQKCLWKMLHISPRLGDRDHSSVAYFRMLMHSLFLSSTRLPTVGLGYLNLGDTWMSHIQSGAHETNIFLGHKPWSPVSEMGTHKQTFYWSS